MCLYVEDTGELLSSGVVKRARKDHRCDECSRTIDAGESYRYWVVLWEGDFLHQKMCAHCWGTIELGSALTGCPKNWWWYMVHDLDPDCGFVGNILEDEGHDLSEPARASMLATVEGRKAGWRHPDGTTYVAASDVAKPVENRGWPPPSTLPQWRRCSWDPKHRYLPNDPSIWAHDRDCGSADYTDDGPFPFRLGIHAGKKADEFAPFFAREAFASLPDHPCRGVIGALVGFVTVTGCHHADERDAKGFRCCRRLVNIGSGSKAWERGCSRWAEPGQYHWTLADPEPLDEPIPMKGRQKLWRIEGADLAALGRVLATAEGVTS